MSDYANPNALVTTEWLAANLTDPALGFDSVKLLDGGRKKWKVEERPTTDEVPVVEKSVPVEK